MKADYKGFRPLAGIMVLIHRFHPYERDKGTTSFRPLAGIMVLIQAGHGIIMKSDVMFPSPCGDYGSYHEKN